MGPAPDILDSWKEIADYFKRDVRVVFQWEKERRASRPPSRPERCLKRLRLPLGAGRLVEPRARAPCR